MRLSFQEAMKRFTHIDAELVRTHCELEAGRVEYVVRFYPWWEHPRYIEAREHDLPWGFSGCETAAREVTVLAVAPHAFALSRRTEVIEWEFCQQHPLLWPYEPEAEIFCNTGFDRAELLRRLIAREIAGVTQQDLYRYIDPLIDYTPPFSLGRFPASLYRHAREELEHMGVKLFKPSEPAWGELPILFLIDEENYIIADDFVLEVPDFEHRPELFQSPSH